MTRSILGLTRLAIAAVGYGGTATRRQSRSRELLRSFFVREGAKRRAGGLRTRDAGSGGGRWPLNRTITRGGLVAPWHADLAKSIAKDASTRCQHSKAGGGEWVSRRRAQGPS